MAASIGFYQVPLSCAVVPGIGCGCLSKPVLARLEEEPDVETAWLHRAGDVIAVQWRRSLARDAQLAQVRRGLGGSAVTVIAQENTPPLLQTFEESGHWYSRRSVDRLSEEEARVLASRFARDLSGAGVSMPDAAALQVHLEEAFRAVLIREDDIPLEVRLQRLVDAARDVLLRHVDTTSFRMCQPFLTPRALLPTQGATRFPAVRRGLIPYLSTALT